MHSFTVSATADPTYCHETKAQAVSVVKYFVIIFFLSQNNTVQYQQFLLKHFLYCLGNITYLSSQEDKHTFQISQKQMSSLYDNFSLTCTKAYDISVQNCDTVFPVWMFPSHSSTYWFTRGITVCILFPFSKPDTVLRLSTRLFPFFLLFLFLVDYLLLHFKVLFRFGTQYIDELLDLICAYKTTHIYLYMLIHLEDSLFRKCIINYGLNNSKTTKNQCTMNNSESKDILFPKNIC